MTAHNSWQQINAEIKIMSSQNDDNLHREQLKRILSQNISERNDVSVQYKCLKYHNNAMGNKCMATQTNI